MSSFPKIRITNDGCITSVEIDGVKQKGVRHVEFITDISEAPTVRIDYIAADMEIDCLVLPALPKAFEPFYTRRNQ